MTTNLMQAAITAYQRGNHPTARKLVYHELEQNPNNLEAWIWACELAESRDEKIHCLEELLLRNPTDWDAQRYLEKLKFPHRPPRPTNKLAPKPTTQKPEQSGFAWVAAGLQLFVAFSCLNYR